MVVRRAVELAKLVGGRVTGFYVLDDSPFAGLPGDLSWGAVFEILKKEASEALAFIETECSEAGVPASTKMAEGHPSDEIIKESRHHDLIVMGTHGRSGLDHLLLGSVAEKVTRHAECPVLMIRVRKQKKV